MADPEKLQFNLDAYLSNMVRADYISRDVAIARTETEGKISKDRLQEVFKILDLPMDSFL